jgi:flagellar motor switch protein FliG
MQIDKGGKMSDQDLEKANGELMNRVKLLEEEQEITQEKQNEQQILFRSEKGMNATLKSQIETLSFTIEELAKLNSRYLSQIGFLRQKLIKYIQNLKQ